MIAGLIDLSRDLGGFALTGIIHGTVLAAVTWLLLATVLRRVRPAVASALWTLVLIKFLVPVGPALPVSLSGAVDGVLSPAETPAPSITAETLVAEPAATSVVAPGPWELAVLALLALYLGAVAWLAVRRVRRHRAALREVAELPGAGPELSAELAGAAKAVGLRKVPPAAVAPGGAGPYLVGLVRPTVVVPASLADRPRELQAALIHELAHVKRRDPWLRTLQLAVTSLLFFYPVVAFASRRLDLAREKACDEWVVARGAMGARAYAQMLVSLVAEARRSGRSAPGAVAAMAGRRPQLEERVAHLLAARTRRPRVGPIAGVCVTGWAVIALAGSARADAPLPMARAECVIDDGLIDRIMATYPEADTDGNGELTRAEICAHQERMKRRLVDEAFDGLSPERTMSVAVKVDPSADLDGDGVIDTRELEEIKSRVATRIDPDALSLDPIAFPGQVCEEGPVSCTEADPEAAPASFPRD